MERKFNIEYLGINVNVDGSQIERKLYYHWDGHYSYLIPSKIKEILLPFDFGVRNNGEETSVSSFLVDDSPTTLDSIFNFVQDEKSCNNLNAIRKQFDYIHDSETGAHYNPIISLKFKHNILRKISLYVAPLHDKSKMSCYVEKTFSTLPIHKNPSIFTLVKRLVIERICDLFMVARDFGAASESNYKIYLKIKKLPNMEGIIHQYFPALAKYLHETSFRFCEIALSFENDELHHFNLYYKPTIPSK